MIFFFLLFHLTKQQIYCVVKPGTNDNECEGIGKLLNIDSVSSTDFFNEKSIDFFVHKSLKLSDKMVLFDTQIKSKPIHISGAQITVEFRSKEYIIDSITFDNPGILRFTESVSSFSCKYVSNALDIINENPSTQIEFTEKIVELSLLSKLFNFEGFKGFYLTVTNKLNDEFVNYSSLYEVELNENNIVLYTAKGKTVISTNMYLQITLELSPNSTLTFNGINFEKLPTFIVNDEASVAIYDKTNIKNVKTNQKGTIILNNTLYIKGTNQQLLESLFDIKQNDNNIIFDDSYEIDEICVFTSEFSQYYNCKYVSSDPNQNSDVFNEFIDIKFNMLHVVPYINILDTNSKLSLDLTLFQNQNIKITSISNSTSVYLENGLEGINSLEISNINVTASFHNLILENFTMGENSIFQVLPKEGEHDSSNNIIDDDIIEKETNDKIAIEDNEVDGEENSKFETQKSYLDSDNNDDINEGTEEVEFKLSDNAEEKEKENTLPKFNIKNYFLCLSICDFIDFCDFHTQIMQIYTNNTQGMDYIYSNTGDTLVISLCSDICFEEILFNPAYVMFTFSNGMKMPIANSALPSTILKLEGHQTKQVYIRNNFTMDFYMSYAPQIEYTYNDSVSYFFDNSWESNNVVSGDKTFFLFNNNTKNIITSTSRISTIKKLFELGDYKFDPQKIQNGAYCISPKESYCAETETVLLHDDGDYIDYNFIHNKNHEIRIRVACDKLTFDAYRFENASVRLFSIYYRPVTLLFAPKQFINSLEFSLLNVE